MGEDLTEGDGGCRRVGARRPAAVSVICRSLSREKSTAGPARGVVTCSHGSGVILKGLPFADWFSGDRRSYLQDRGVSVLGGETFGIRGATVAAWFSGDRRSYLQTEGSPSWVAKHLASGGLPFAAWFSGDRRSYLQTEGSPSWVARAQQAGLARDRAHVSGRCRCVSIRRPQRAATPRRSCPSPTLEPRLGAADR